MLVASLLTGIFICFGVPAVGLVVLLGRHQKKGVGLAFLWGALAFFVSQVVIRIPILQIVLPGMAWYAVLQMDPWAYGLFLGFTAGLFEEGARWIAMRLLLKGKTERVHGLAFGLGHGGIEAMLLVGINFLVILVMVLAGQASLFPLEAGGVFLSGVERLYAMAFHVGASLLVMHGIRRGRQVLWLGIAILLHTLMDAAIVILGNVFGVCVMGIELFGAVSAILTLALGLGVYAREKKVE